ncbi:MAG: trypsin-like peptidase domain-containing protein [Anaerolineae bacterium]|nr:trypsin-like peptidase domain-containing protein [Anaerolineae bacterium]
MHKRIVVTLAGLLLLAGCRAAEIAPPQAIASTPVESLRLVRAQNATPVPQAVIDAADAEYVLLTNIYERMAPAVVNIEIRANHPGTDTVIDFGRGSGFVWDTQGHIVTNAHVVDGASSIEVTFNDGHIAPAELVGVDPFSDLAVIQVEADPDRLHPVTLADSDLVRVGQRAIAIGNPFGLASSMTLGIVSGLGRQLPSAQLLNADLPAGFSNPSIIQVDTDINPGNSGGPLLDSHAQVIGVNTAIRTDSGVFQGVGFAIPANTVQRVVPELISAGRVDYAWLGISTLLEDDGYSVAALAEPLNLPVEAGVLVDRVTIGSPADKAGLQGGQRLEQVRGRAICAGGDIIIAVNGRFVKNLDELVAYLVVHSKPNDVVTLLIVRDGETFELPLTLEPRPTTDTGESVNKCS